MNIQIHPESDPLNQCVFRAADRMRIDGCANAVANEGLSLALFCPYEALLDHYVNLLLSRLRQQAPDHRIEVYFPANTDSLLGRFNEVLASQTLNQAVKAPATVNQAQIWLVHDAQNLPDSEIQLLARLIQNFPGANIRAILLMSGNDQAAKSPLSAFGRKILRWDIEAPTQEQAQAALEQARNEGYYNALQTLVQRIQRRQNPDMDPVFHASSVPDSVPASAPKTSPAAAGKNTINAFQQRGAAALKSWKGMGWGPAMKWVRLNSKLALGIAIALILSTLMMLWIQPEAFGLKSGKPVSAGPLQSPQLTAKLPASETVKTTENLPSPAPAMAVTPPEPPIETPEGTQTAQVWLQQLDASSFLLQHGTASTYEKVQEIQRKYTALKDAKIIAAYHPGEKLAHFVIVSGPFSNLGEGYEASKRPGIPRSWVRPTRGLQQQVKSAT